MSINIAAKHIEMNDYLKSHIEDKIDHLESKYNVKMIADVHFDKSGNNIKAKIKITGFRLKRITNSK